jgi:hypothetical protein
LNGFTCPELQEESGGAGAELKEPQSPAFCAERNGGNRDADLKSGDRPRECLVFSKKVVRRAYLIFVSVFVFAAQSRLLVLTLSPERVGISNGAATVP